MPGLSLVTKIAVAVGGGFSTLVASQVQQKNLDTNHNPASYEKHPIGINSPSMMPSKTIAGVVENANDASSTTLQYLFAAGFSICAVISMLTVEQRNFLHEFLTALLGGRETNTENLGDHKLKKRRKIRRRIIEDEILEDEDDLQEHEEMKVKEEFYEEEILPKKNESKCIVCWENPADHIIEGCFHLCICEQCAPEIEKVGKCPVCNYRFNRRGNLPQANLPSPPQMYQMPHQPHNQAPQNNIRGRRFVHRVYEAGTVLG